MATGSAGLGINPSKWYCTQKGWTDPPPSSCHFHRPRYEWTWWSACISWQRCLIIYPCAGKVFANECSGSRSRQTTVSTAGKVILVMTIQWAAVYHLSHHSLSKNLKTGSILSESFQIHRLCSLCHTHLRHCNTKNEPNTLRLGLVLVVCGLFLYLKTRASGLSKFNYREQSIKTLTHGSSLPGTYFFGGLSQQATFSAACSSFNGNITPSS